MISKLRNYHRKIRKVVPVVILPEIIKLHIFSFGFLMTMLMIIHLIFTGEFGFCYWSFTGGWIWE